MFNWLRATSVAIAAVCLSGCSEITNRGGFMDKLQDSVLFPADAKSHRVLRSYVMVGALASIARRASLSDQDATALAARMFAAHEAIYDAFVCAYESRSGCIYFDERMIKVDYALLKLALAVLLDPEVDEFTRIREKFGQNVPVLSSLGKAAVNLVGTAKNTADAASQAGEIVDSLLKLGYIANQYGPRLFALYRDSLEMDVVVIVDRYARACVRDLDSKGQLGKVSLPINRHDLVTLVRNVPKKKVDQKKGVHVYQLNEGDGVELIPLTCAGYLRVYAIYGEGNGDFDSWRELVYSEAYEVNAMTPTAWHFFTVSRLIYQSCIALMKDDRTLMGCTGDRRFVAKTDAGPFKDKKKWAMLYGCMFNSAREEKNANRALKSAMTLARQKSFSDTEVYGSGLFADPTLTENDYLCS